VVEIAVHERAAELEPAEKIGPAGEWTRRLQHVRQLSAVRRGYLEEMNERFQRSGPGCELDRAPEHPVTLLRVQQKLPRAVEMRVPQLVPRPRIVGVAAHEGASQLQGIASSGVRSATVSRRVAYRVPRSTSAPAATPRKSGRRTSARTGPAVGRPWLMSAGTLVTA
jgi:hypothetical protein